MQHPDLGTPEPGGPALELNARVRTKAGATFHGVVRSVHDAVAMVDFPAQESPVVPLAQELDLEVSGPGLAGAVETWALVVQRGEDEVRQRYGLRIDPVSSEVLGNLFNRRRAPRVAPDPSRPIDVALRGCSSERAVARLQDVSESGVAVMVDRAQEDALYRAWRLDVSFHLPGETTPVELATLVRYRMLCGASIRYGLLFDPCESAHFAHQQGRIAAYVARRQREIVGRRSG